MNTCSGHAFYDSMPDFDLVMMEAPVVKFKNAKEKKNRERHKERPRAESMKQPAMNLRRQ